MHIHIRLADQELKLLSGPNTRFQAKISTAANGAGEQNGSGCTPRGALYIRLKIGAGCAPNTVFVGRRPSGEIFTPALGLAQPQRDWILSRILWLGGLEAQRNRGGEVDTLRRYIYIHGCPDGTPMGVPASHGCVRMCNRDVIRLFDLVENGTKVYVEE